MKQTWKNLDIHTWYIQDWQIAKIHLNNTMGLYEPNKVSYLIVNVIVLNGLVLIELFSTITENSVHFLLQPLFTQSHRFCGWCHLCGHASTSTSTGALCAGILSYLFQQFQQPPPGNLLTFVSTYYWDNNCYSLTDKFKDCSKKTARNAQVESIIDGCVKAMCRYTSTHRVMP